MKRKIEDFLVHWKNEETRKPLVIYGTKQVGKTYTAIKFGEEEYKNTVYIDGNNDQELLEVLKKENTFDGVIAKLEEYTNETIEKNTTLLIVDNIINPDLVNIFKPFGKFKNDYHVILIISLRENLSKFKGEELQYKSMLPMDFEEYLMAFGKTELIDFIKNSFKNKTKNPFHSVALEYFNDFVCTGGMPEAVYNVVEERNKLYLNSIYDKIIDIYRKESIMQDNLIDITRSFEIYESVAKQL
jgi:predicted AAA+ superfamily ATPase